MIRVDNKRKLLIGLFAVYLTFILITTVSFIAEQNLSRGRAENDAYISNLEFLEDGEYGHYKQVNLSNPDSVGKISLKYTYSTNTLYIQKIENIKELVIDCELLYKNSYKKVFGKEPISLEGADFIIGNDGVFTVIINSNTPMDKLQFLDSPMPKKVIVNKEDWWETETNYYSVDNNDITISYIPTGSTTVEIYFREAKQKNPEAEFTADNYIVLVDEEITFDASGSKDEDGRIVDYIWDLGDSTKNINKVIKHSYSKVGNYSVSLLVRDDDDLVDVFSDNITVIDSNIGFQEVIVDDVEIDIRSAASQNLTIEVPEEEDLPDMPEETANDFNFFLNITADENVTRFQLKINLGLIGGDIIPKDTDPSSIKLYYYDEDMNKWVVIKNSHYDPKTGILTATLDHLTIFAPMSSETSSKESEKEESSTEQYIIYAIVIIVIIGILSIVGVSIKRRRKGRGKPPQEPGDAELEDEKEDEKEDDEGDEDIDWATENDVEEKTTKPEVKFDSIGTLMDTHGLDKFGTAPGGEPQAQFSPKPGGEPQAIKSDIKRRSSTKAKRSIQPEGLLDDDLPFTILDDETLDDETLDDETLDDETFDDETLEDETLEDETLEDETFDDETFDDETFDDETFDDETLDDETLDDETLEDPTSEDDTLDPISKSKAFRSKMERKRNDDD